MALPDRQHLSKAGTQLYGCKVLNVLAAHTTWSLTFWKSRNARHNEIQLLCACVKGNLCYQHKERHVENSIADSIIAKGARRQSWEKFHFRWNQEKFETDSNIQKGAKFFLKLCRTPKSWFNEMGATFECSCSNGNVGIWMPTIASGVTNKLPRRRRRVMQINMQIDEHKSCQINGE